MMHSYEVFTTDFSMIVQAESMETALEYFKGINAFTVIAVIDTAYIVEFIGSERFKLYRDAL